MSAICTPETLSRHRKGIGRRVFLLMVLSTYLVVIVAARSASPSLLEAFDPSSTSTLELLAYSLSLSYALPYSREAKNRLGEVIQPWAKVHVFE